MLGFISAFFTVILAFLPFHFLSSPERGDIEIVKIDLNKVIPDIPEDKDILKVPLRFHLSSDPKTLNPALAMETSSTAVISDIFTGLTKLDLKTMRVKPDLAESWEVSQEGTVWIFKLKKGIRWSDGKPFTADDVVFTFNEIYLNDNIPTPMRDILTIEGKKIKVEKLDNYTVKFILPKPFAPFLNSLGAEILPKHKLEKFIKEGNFSTSWNVNTDPRDLVGTGPYKIEEYIKGQRVIYRKNPYYYEKDEKGRRLPYIEEKVGVIIPDPETALLKFVNGEIDYISVRAQDIIFLAHQKKKDFIIYDLGATPSITFLVFNQNPNAKIPKYKLKWFRNKIFRIAISHAIDRESIVRLVYNGLAKPLYTPITPANIPYYDEKYYPKFEFNLQKSKYLLESIGFKDRDGDGILEDPEGHKLEFTLITNAGNKEREMMGAIIKEDLKKIGIKVHFQPIDFNTLVSKLTAPPYEWEAVIIGLTGSIDPHFGRNVWHSSGTLHMWYPRQKKPSTEWEKQVDELIDKGATELDFERRVKIYKKAFKIITEQQPMIFIVAPKSMIAVRKSLKNVFPTVWGWYEPLRIYSISD